MDRIFRDIIEKHKKSMKKNPTAIMPVIKKIPGVKIILFDIYGTLLSSDNKLAFGNAEIDESTENDLIGFINDYGLDSTPSGLIKKVIGEIVSTNRLAMKFNEFPEVNILKIWRKISGYRDHLLLKRIALEFEMIVNNVGPLGDLNGIFDLLREKNIVPGFISNAQFYTELIMEYYLERKPEEAGINTNLMLFSYRYRTAKPSRKLFDKALKRICRMGMSADDVLFIGNDYANDIRPASEAGFKTGLYAGEMYMTDKNETGIMPDAVLTDWTQLKEII